MLISLAVVGACLILLSSAGDASVVATTGSVYAALEAAGQEGNLRLRDDLYAAVMRLQRPWAVVWWAGAAVLTLSLGGLALSGRAGGSGRGSRDESKDPP